jgi:dTMP kinase
MSKHEKGRFITLEGVEGVGKSTNLEVIQRFLDEMGVEFIVTREPGGTPVAEEIRDLLLAEREEELHELSELLLIFAARSQHLEALIKPALERGLWVLCDRFTDATYAYQGGGRNLSADTIATLETLAQGDLRPDLTLILDLDPEVGLERASKRGALDRFEKEQVTFFHRVRAIYLARAEADPSRCRVIDASMPIDQVEQQLINLLEERFRPNSL